MPPQFCHILWSSCLIIQTVGIIYLWCETLLTRKLAASTCIWTDLFAIPFQAHSRWHGTRCYCYLSQTLLVWHLRLHLVNAMSKNLRGVISKIRAKKGTVIIGDTADPNSALCIHMIHLSYDEK